MTICTKISSNPILQPHEKYNVQLPQNECKGWSPEARAQITISQCFGARLTWWPYRKIMYSVFCILIYKSFLHQRCNWKIPHKKKELQKDKYMFALASFGWKWYFTG
jgi:hypothetical protein